MVQYLNYVYEIHYVHTLNILLTLRTLPTLPTLRTLYTFGLYNVQTKCTSPPKCVKYFLFKNPCSPKHRFLGNKLSLFIKTQKLCLHCYIYTLVLCC